MSTAGAACLVLRVLIEVITGCPCSDSACRVVALAQDICRAFIYLHSRRPAVVRYSIHRCTCKPGFGCSTTNQLDSCIVLDADPSRHQTCKLPGGSLLEGQGTHCGVCKLPLWHVDVQAYHPGWDTNTVLLPRVQVCDFGLASNSRSQAGAGTPAYMAPELLDSGAFNEKVGGNTGPSIQAVTV
jgi:serine/threonine protein kinase